MKLQLSLGKPLTKPLNYSQHVTMIGCISASGRRLPHYSIIKAPKTSIGNITIHTQGNIIFNESGWVDTKQKVDFIKYFGDSINRGLTKPYPLTVLYLDNHSSNLQEEVADALNEYNIHYWKSIKASYLDELENNDDKSLACVSNTLVINEKPSSTQIADARKIGFQINSLGVGNTIKIDEAPKKRGRPSKVTINSTVNVLNVNIQNNFNIPITDFSSPVLKLNKNGQPRKKYTKKLKAIHDSTINQQNSNKISEID
ncbi:hypothetical protein DDB_G0292434 [Dictyostelium discoideum AX4]|uniref:DDE-1 domain-containing protein n=1 Tax=Dictyostelium discoideum TaxID=44689 RepID=Q54D85_DICDI|nr:hypothetical protein DDB_G0292434 [Dictyostelium discoideum AX4]EAL61196.1 hypothetical protein DDB_G0292434 [Dictyostelium discoideum AX4]|eukprot:XP_629611.1 hypothetical protein DDB_G0292434 [Dictyostelium discoideum AX4]